MPTPIPAAVRPPVDPWRIGGYALLAGCLAAFCWSVLSDPLLQLDFRLMCAAARVWSRGANPYDLHPFVRLFRLKEGLLYLYPPDTLPLFGLFNLLPPSLAAGAFLVIKLVLAGFLLRLWQRVFLDPEDRGSVWFAAFCLFGLGNTFLVDLRAGNISLWEQAMLWAGLSAYLRGQAWAFCVWLWFAAAFKLMLLTFSILLLLDGPPGRQPLKFVCVWGAMAGRLALDYLANPKLFGEFLQALAGLNGVTTNRALNPSSLELLRDFIWGSLGESAPGFLLPATYGLLVAGVALVTWRACRALRRQPDTPRRGVLLICLVSLAYGLTVPRLIDYSCILLLVPVWVAVKTALAGRRDAWLAVVAAACLLGHPLLPVPHAIYVFLWSYYVQVVAWTAWGLLVWHLRTYPVDGQHGSGADEATEPVRV